MLVRPRSCVGCKVDRKKEKERKQVEIGEKEKKEAEKRRQKRNRDWLGLLYTAAYGVYYVEAICDIQLLRSAIYPPILISE